MFCRFRHILSPVMFMESIWKENVKFPRFPQLQGDKEADVVVVGGGISGILTAYKMKEAGISCILLEAKQLCSGVTGNTTAKLTAQHGLIYEKLLNKYGADRAKAYYKANEQALRQYEELCRKFPCDYEKQDSFIYSRKDSDRLRAELRALRCLSIPAEFVRRVDLPIPTAAALCFRNQAQFHPLKFLSQLVKDLNIYENSEVTGFEEHMVRSEQGTVTAKHIIICTHFPIVNRHGSYFLKQYQNRSYVLALDKADFPQGMYMDENEDGLSFRHYKDTLLLGGSAHRTGKPGRAWAPLEEFANKHYPSAEITAHWAAQDCMTLDSVPYIGNYSRGTESWYVATGFNKWGMTSSMAAAQLLCDMVQEKENPYKELFSPSRSMFHRQLVENVLESTKNLLTLSRPRCPHLGCALKWNKQEHSWDCPCHGSRFAEDGKLLDNPATRDLER